MGRKRKLTDVQIAMARARLRAGEPRFVIARDLRVSRPTLDKYLRANTNAKPRPERDARPMVDSDARTLPASEAARPFPFRPPRRTPAQSEAEEPEREDATGEAAPALTGAQLVGLAEVAVGVLVRAVAFRLRGRVAQVAVDAAATFTAADRAQLIPSANLAAPIVDRWLGAQSETTGLWIFGGSLAMLALAKLGMLRAATADSDELAGTVEEPASTFDRHAAAQVASVEP